MHEMINIPHYGVVTGYTTTSGRDHY